METNSEIGETKSIYKDGRFYNPWSTWTDTKFWTFLKWSLFTKNNTQLPNDPKVIKCFIFIISFKI